ASATHSVRSSPRLRGGTLQYRAVAGRRPVQPRRESFRRRFHRHGKTEGCRPDDKRNGGGISPRKVQASARYHPTSRTTGEPGVALRSCWLSIVWVESMPCLLR